MKKVLLLGSQHGDELLGEQLYNHLLANHQDMLPHVDYIVANPNAKKKGVRFIESDLNRSYSGKNDTYEERRALELLSLIADKKYDLVLDLHTTTCRQPPCLITAATDHPFIRSSSIEKIVNMNHDIVRSSLIGVCKEAISIEINKQECDDAILELLVSDIKNFILDNATETVKETYEVSDLLRKNEVTESEAAGLQNFQKSPLGFYPVLVGENSYKKHTEYLGFKAYKVSN